MRTITESYDHDNERKDLSPEITHILPKRANSSTCTPCPELELSPNTISGIYRYHDGFRDLVS